jgi:hypothetical protein
MDATIPRKPPRVGRPRPEQKELANSMGPRSVLVEIIVKICPEAGKLAKKTAYVQEM